MARALPFLDLSDPGFSTRGAAVRAAREASWCAETPYGLAVLRYREVGQILRDRRFRQGSHNWPELMEFKGKFADFWRQSMIGQEGAEHQRLRALAVPALSPEYVTGLVPDFRHIARALCADMRQTDHCDFIAGFCEPFAGQAMTTLLGMAREDWQQVAQDATELGLAMGIGAKRYEARFNAACARLFDLADGLVARVRRGADEESYVARVVAQFDANGDCSHEELLNTIVISIFGGVDTTRALLGLGMSLFVEHPAQWQALRRDASLIPAAVEEFIRARPTATWATREATQDVEIGGCVIEKGTLLHLLVHASARDPEICADARFDITAKRRQHFGFGGGAHHCIGHFVARTDIAAALAELRLTFKTISYDGTPDWLPDSGNTGAVSLPVRYEVSR